MPLRISCILTTLVGSAVIQVQGFQIPDSDSVGVRRSPAQSTQTSAIDSATDVSLGPQKRSVSKFPDRHRDAASLYATDGDGENARVDSTHAPPSSGGGEATTSVIPGPSQIRAISELTRASLQPGLAEYSADRQVGSIEVDLDQDETNSNDKNDRKRRGRYSDGKHDYNQLHKNNMHGSSGGKRLSLELMPNDPNSHPADFRGPRPSGLSRRGLWRDYRDHYSSDRRHIYSARRQFGEQMSASGGVSYGYGGSPSCECTQYDVIGLLAGGAALAGLGAFVLQQITVNNGGGRELGGRWAPGLPAFLQSGISLDGSAIYFPVPSFKSLLLEPWNRLTHGDRVVWDGSDPRSAFGRVLRQLPDGFLQRSLSDLVSRVTPRAMAGVAVRAVCAASGYRGQVDDLDVDHRSRMRREEAAATARDGKQSAAAARPRVIVTCNSISADLNSYKL